MSAELIHRLYTAFAQRDGEAMARCYHAQARFRDPVFPDLRGDQIGAMWTMLCRQGKDLVVEFTDVEADEERGSAHWEAHYSFGSGRPVHNVIQAEFRFRDGLIVDHRDNFDLRRWCGQALGPLGQLLGWNPLLHAVIRRQALRGLRAWQARHP